jgi:hypothetical protein
VLADSSTDKPQLADAGADNDDLAMRLADEPRETILCRVQQVRVEGGYRRAELIAAHGPACPMPSVFMSILLNGRSPLTDEGSTLLPSTRRGQLARGRQRLPAGLRSRRFALAGQPPRRARLRADARGRDGHVREELAARETRSPRNDPLTRPACNARDRPGVSTSPRAVIIPITVGAWPVQRIRQTGARLALDAGRPDDTHARGGRLSARVGIMVFAAIGAMLVHYSLHDSFGFGVGVFALTGAFMLYRIFFWHE